MKWPDNKPYYSLNQFYKDLFGTKAYKIALDINVSCPNRDGTLDSRGCIFCSRQGSGDFAVSTKTTTNINEQIDKAIDVVSGKYNGNTFIAYLQSFTNTYGDYNYLESVYRTIINHPRIAGLAIGTRPDCLPNNILSLLEELNRIKPVFVELGLQTIHESSAKYIRRCYTLSTFDQAVKALKERNINVIVHLIAGLPGEAQEDFLDSVRYVALAGVDGIKLQLLHILNDSDLGDIYLEKPFPLLTLEAYCKWITEAISLLPPKMVVHRITGDGNRHTLIGPLWSLNKRNVLNSIHKTFAVNKLWQGKNLQREGKVNER